MDRYQNPNKYGKLEKFDLKIDESSSSCGDRIVLYVRTNDGKVEDMKWEGEGCILSMVSTDLFCENSVGRDLNSLKAIDNMKFIEEFPIKTTSGRFNCVLLPLSALRRRTKEK